jgi:hypothetical protein
MRTFVGQAWELSRVNVSDSRVISAERVVVASRVTSVTLLIVSAILGIFSLLQIARIASGFNGASSDEGLHLTAGLRTWHGEIIADRLLTQLPGSMIWPAFGAAAHMALGIDGARILAFALVMVAILGMVLGTRRLFGDRAAMMTTLAFAVSAPYLVVAHLALMESLALAGMALCFYSITTLIARDDRLWLLIASVALVVGMLGQYRAALFAIPMMLLLLTARGQKGQLDVIVLFLASSLGFIVYFEAFSQQVEVALTSLSLLTPSATPNAFATETGKRLLVVIWGALPLAVAFAACFRGSMRARKVSLALIAGPAIWVVALLAVADTGTMLVFPDLAVGLLAAYPVIGLTLSRVTMKGLEGVAMGAVVLFAGALGWVHMDAFDRSWADYRPVTSALVRGMDEGDGVLVNDRWAFALDLYGEGLIEDPADLVDAESILTNSELLDLCSFEWFVAGSGPLAWPAFVDGVVSSCGGFEQRVSAQTTVTGISNQMRETTSTMSSRLLFNTTPFEEEA